MHSLDRLVETTLTARPGYALQPRVGWTYGPPG